MKPLEPSLPGESRREYLARVDGRPITTEREAAPMTDPYYLLVLWFMRDLTDADRAALFRIYGKSDLSTNDEQRRAFRRILMDAALQRS